MTVKLMFRKQRIEAKSGMTLRDTLLKNDIEPDSVLAVINDELITDDEILQDGQKIRLIAVISGG